MNINISGITSYLQMGQKCQFAADQMGELANHAVKALKQALEYVRQDGRAAGATVAVANVVFLETALLVTRLTDRALIRCFGPEENWGQKGILANSFVILSLTSSLIVGMNVALYKGLKSPLSPLATAAISAGTCASYILFRLCRVIGNGSEGNG